MVISDEEEKKIRKKIREELEIEERERIESLRKIERFNNNQNELVDEVDEKRIEIIENEKRIFYEEKGYVPVKNKSGNTKWISKEEYEQKKHKIKVKRKSSGKELNPVEKSDEKSLKRIFVIILAFVLFAIFLTLITSLF